MQLGIAREDPFRLLRPPSSRSFSDHPESFAIAERIQNDAKIFGEKLNHPWNREVRTFLRGLKDYFPDRLDGLACQLARSFDPLCDAFEQKGGHHLQFELPVLTRALLDSTFSITNNEIPIERTLVRRCAKHALALVDDPSLGRYISAERREEAYIMYRDLVAGRWPSNIGWMSYNVQQTWADWPECLYDPEGWPEQNPFEDISIKLYQKGANGIDHIVQEIEEVQREWMKRGKEGVGTIFTAQALKERFNLTSVDTDIGEIKYQDELLGHFIVHADPNQLPSLVHSRIESSHGFERIRTEGGSHSWLFLILAKPKSGEGPSAAERFRHNLHAPFYPFMLRVCANVAIAKGATDMFAVVNEKNPAWISHNNAGFIDTEARVETEFGRLRIMAMPLELPYSLLKEIMHLGKK